MHRILDAFVSLNNLDFNLVTKLTSFRNILLEIGSCKQGTFPIYRLGCLPKGTITPATKNPNWEFC